MLDVLNQIKQKGIDVRDQKLTMYVDGEPCKACGEKGGIASMLKQLGLKELTIISPSGTSSIK